MKTLINSNKKLERRFMRLLTKLPPEQFFGVTTILGIELSEKEKDNLAQVSFTKDKEGNTKILLKKPEEEDTVEKNTVEKNTVEEDTVEEDTVEEEENNEENIVEEDNEENNEKDNGKDTAMQTIAKRFADMKNAPEEEEKEDEEIRDSISLIFLTINKFKNLNLQQKKSLIKIMKAAV